MNGKYVLWDSKNNYFWQKNLPYGYNWQNKAVLKAIFTNKLHEATLISWQEVRELVDKFKNHELVMGGDYRADYDSLQRMAVEPISQEDADYLRGRLSTITRVTVHVDEQDS